MVKVAPSDSMLAAVVRGAPCTECPQSESEYLARLEQLARDFMPPDPILTCTTMRWWLNRVVEHLRTRDVHHAVDTIQ